MFRWLRTENREQREQRPETRKQFSMLSSPIYIKPSWHPCHGMCSRICMQVPWSLAPCQTSDIYYDSLFFHSENILNSLQIQTLRSKSITCLYPLPFLFLLITTQKESISRAFIHQDGLSSTFLTFFFSRQSNQFKLIFINTIIQPTVLSSLT